MKMSWLEKRLVNRRRKAERNIAKIRRLLGELDIPAPLDALELGCGIGAVSAFLAESCGMNVVGADYDPDQIALARRMHAESERLRFQVEDAARLSFAGASFSLVVSQNVFHHVPDWRAAVREVARVLRPEGYLIWHDLVFPALAAKLAGPLLKNYGLYTLSEIEAAFEKCALTVIHRQRFSRGPFAHYELVMRKN